MGLRTKNSMKNKKNWKLTQDFLLNLVLNLAIGFTFRDSMDYI